ncbi:hypothetical protein PSPO_a3234 [Pseudoalteromonas spongiae UST010723-006]|nr:hypothetical protein PSPO_a3234 [Pseudoalteromonas spongiae UST010723-006]
MDWFHYLSSPNAFLFSIENLMVSGINQSKNMKFFNILKYSAVYFPMTSQE